MPTATNNVIIGTDETPAEVGVGGHIAVAQSFDQIVPCVRTPITAGSGGTQLENIPCGSVLVRNASGNSPMFVGGVGQYSVYSGRGLTLYANETITLPVKNANAVAVMAMVSGEHIECMAFLTGPNVPVDTSGMWIQPDTIAPSIFEVSPTSGVSGVATTEPIWVQFSECMNPGTVDTNSFVVRISGDATNVSGIVFADFIDCAKFHFQPYSGTISGGTMYRATLATSITDAAGNGLAASGVWHWTTIGGAPPPDTVLPNVSGTVPASGDMNVSISTPITVLFSEPMQSGTVNNSTVRLQLSGINLPTTVTLGPDLRTATMTPVNFLENMKTYGIRFTQSSLLDLAGNSMSGSQGEHSFFTEDGNITLAYNISPSISGATHTLMSNKFRIGTKVRVGANPSYIGEQLVKIRMHLRRTSGSILNGATSGVVVHIRKASDNSTIQFGRPFSPFLNPADLTTSIGTYEFYNADNFYQLQQNDKIEIQWLSGAASDVSGRIKVYAVNVSLNDGLVFNQYVGSNYSGAIYEEYSGREIAGMMWVR